jgi:hypothetical protein
MATFERIKLSETDDRNSPKPVMTTSFTTVHNTLVDATVQDEIWLWAMADSTGGVADATNFKVYIGNLAASYPVYYSTLSAGVPTLLCAGYTIKGDGTNAGQVGVTFSGGTTWVTVWGYVNRITP